MDPDDGGGRTRPTAALAIIGGVILATLVLVVAAVAGTRHEGYASPEEALDAFFAALDHGTVSDLLATLPPDEAAALADTLPALGIELERLGLVGAADDDAGFGLDVEAPSVNLTSFEEWIARADLSGGTLASRPDDDAGGQVLTADGRAAVEQILGIELPGTESEVLSDRWPQLMVVRDGGGWRVSPAYTIAEQWRLDDEQPEPSWGEGAIAIGADEPAEAVTDLYRSIQYNDPGRTQSLVEPREAKALYQYWPLMLPGVAEDWQRAREDDDFFFTVDDIQVAVEGDGRRRLVDVTAYEGSFGDDETQVRLSYADGCLTIRTTRSGAAAEAAGTDVEVEERCDGELHASGPDVGPWSSLLAHTALGRAFPTFSVAEDHGRWFVSPTRTALGTLTDIAAGLQPDQADELVTALDAAWQPDL